MQARQAMTADHLSRSNRIWFPIMNPERFSEGRVRDMTEVHLRYPNIRRLPGGIFIFSMVAVEHPQEIALLMEMDLAASGRMIPTGSLGNGWKLGIHAGNERLRCIKAISLMLTSRMQQVQQQREFVGTAQPLFALNEGRGTCFERASILAAIFRLNGVEARIVGGTKIVHLPGAMPMEGHHW